MHLYIAGIGGAFTASQLRPATQAAATPTDGLAISFPAKRARGLMSRFILDKGLSEARAIKRFRGEGYRYAASLSNDDERVFVRPQKGLA